MDQPTNQLETQPRKELTTTHIESRMEKYQYPITQRSEEIYELVDSNKSSIVIGHTGSGKSTIVPPILLKHKIETGANGKIAVTQPRTIAARTVSERVADILDTKIGDVVGYRYRGESKVSKNTEIEFLTDGLLLSEIKNDPLLEKYSYVMVDEAHERSLNIDFLLGLLKKTNKSREEAGLNPIKVIVASATIDKEKFEEYFSEPDSENPNSIEVEGKLFPITKKYLPYQTLDYTSEAAKTLKTSLESSDEGHILIFMPGKKEIEDTLAKVVKLLETENKIEEFQVIPLHSELNSDEQRKAFAKTDKRKIIIATNIAETSVTIDGVGVVIDSGVIKQSDYDPISGTKVLKTVEHSAAGLDQRAGRAGRTNPGTCYRLFTEENFNNRNKHSKPEINRSDITSVLLQMKAMGINNVYEYSDTNPEGFDYIQAPDKKSIDSSLQFLKSMDLIDDKGEITSLGAEVSKLPLEPRLGKMVVEAKMYDCVPEIVTIASFVNSTKSIFLNPDRLSPQIASNQAELKKDNSFLSILKTYVEYIKVPKEKRDSWLYSHGIDQKTFKEALNSRSSIIESLKDISAGGPPKLTSENSENIQKCIFAAFIDNMSYETRGSYTTSKRLSVSNIYADRNGQDPDGLFIYGYSNVTKDRRGRDIAFLNNVMNVKPEWVVELAPSLVESQSTIEFRNGQFQKQTDRSIRISGMKFNIDDSTENLDEVSPEDYLRIVKDYQYQCKDALTEIDMTLNKIRLIYPNMSIPNIESDDYVKLFAEMYPQKDFKKLTEKPKAIFKEFILDFNPEVRKILEEYGNDIEREIKIGSRTVKATVKAINEQPSYLVDLSMISSSDIISNYSQIKEELSKYPIYVSAGYTYHYGKNETSFDEFVSNQAQKVCQSDTYNKNYRENPELEKFPNEIPMSLEYLTVDSEIINPVNSKPVPVYIFKRFIYSSVSILVTVDKSELNQAIEEARALNKVYFDTLEVKNLYENLNQRLERVLQNENSKWLADSNEVKRFQSAFSTAKNVEKLSSYEISYYKEKFKEFDSLLELLNLGEEFDCDIEKIRNAYLDKADELINEELSSCPDHGWPLNAENDYTCKYSHTQSNNQIIKRVSSTGQSYTEAIFAALINTDGTLRAYFYDGQGVNNFDQLDGIRSFRQLKDKVVKPDDLNPVGFSFPEVRS